MAVKVSLKDIVTGIDLGFVEEQLQFLDPDSGRVESVSRSLLSKAEESDPDNPGDEPRLPAWQKHEWETAKRIASASHRFPRLPTERDVHEWSIMDDFARSVSSEKDRAELLDALHGAGAFRMFKNTIRRQGIEKAWFAYRDEAVRQIAIEWCEEHQVEWE